MNFIEMECFPTVSIWWN